MMFCVTETIFLWADGEIGRHACLRSMFRKDCGFKSHSAHQTMSPSFEQNESEALEARTLLTKSFREGFLEFFGDESVTKILGAIESGEIGREGLQRFLIQQIVATSAFLSLFEKLVAQNKFPELQAAAASNLRDETGMDEEGNYHAELSHSTWRKDFYKQIGIVETQISQTPPTPGTKAYFDDIAALVAEGDTGKIAGALLFFEGTIPRQFNSFKRGRDTLFREECVDIEGDDATTLETKRKARIYLDDHIVHDAQSHFPDLLNALTVAVQSSPEVLEKVKVGIASAKEARKKFYQGQEY